VPLRFEWDESKDRGNQRKHGVSFPEAMTVFSDEHALFQADTEHSQQEDRFLLLGLSASLRTRCMPLLPHPGRRDPNHLCEKGDSS